ncbi:DNA gyrase subunit B [Arthrobacter stackebrandtii]|uniref:DNA topoisomerase (ATP-hydrolyzing) n=1 Tax=Arthrobacter stackebrandtii TaxID=272161 RepID=A0ABS4YZ31_9MICC|nr:ATP-binding protein [Arthrobacter stackebrandtii]MBP2413984.1 DNA gyrase subunit B [Arthrobacter stackebrandtii]PYG99000.1 ATP-binding protein [Arthrobacter stackebrandtii]
MAISPNPWTNTTHDWAAAVDTAHLASIAADPGRYAPGGVWHLLLEVAAHPVDEAEDRGARGLCTVTAHADGSWSVADDGRGTDTRLDASGQPVKKPVMSTKDLRFFDGPASEMLPDGFARRGMSVVSALSTWLVHTNRRLDGSWTQRYERGVPAALLPVPADGTTGTTVRFMPGREVPGGIPPERETLQRLSRAWPQLEWRFRQD